MSESRTLSVDLRPKTFAEIIGNGEVVQAIERQLQAGSVPIGWLFSGPAGCGKTTLAQILARAVQRQKWSEPDNFDIREINAADFNGVDDVRELVRGSALRPLYGDYRVNILDEAHKLTEPAQNVLLKPFEDLNSPTIWVIATTEPEKLIKPLRDRCLSFQLRPLAAGEIQALVVRAEEELGGITGASEIAHFSSAAYDAGVRSPREILMAWEKIGNGIPMAQALAGAEHEPLYADAARSVLAGSWGPTRELLQKIKTSDARALRGVVIAFLNGALLNAQTRPECELFRQCINEFERSAFEDGVAKALTNAAIFQSCILIGDFRRGKK